MITLIEGREFKVTLVSAQNLPDIRSLGQMKVYAEVSLNGIPETIMISDVDEQGKINPTWSFVAGYTVSEAAVQLPGINLVVKLLCKRTLGDKLVGEVKIPLKNLSDVARDSDHRKIRSYDVEGTSDGVLNISFSFSQKMAAVPDRAPPPSSSDNQKILQTVGLSLSVFSAMSLD